ncbi:MAG: hypothetical protein AB4911_21210 [Oscillochloridaceae bacterium umkhey_bin13]
METPLLLAIQTAARTYLVPRHHLDHLVGMRAEAIPAQDARGRPLLGCELGPLLDPNEPSQLTGRCHALTVSLRRRSVALIVARADELAAPGPIQPLAPLLARCLNRPWVLGVVVTDDQPILVLDVRRIAADVALGVV